MPNASRRSAANQRYAHGHHDPNHCSLQCPYCGPDSAAWAVGEIIADLVIAVLAVVGWLVRRPVAAIAVVVVLAIAWVVAGPR